MAKKANKKAKKAKKTKKKSGKTKAGAKRGEMSWLDRVRAYYGLAPAPQKKRR